MSQFVLAHEGSIRLIFFLSTLAIMATWELRAPRRRLTVHKKQRWFTNLSIVAIDAIAVRLLVPLLPVSLAIVAQQQDWGLLNILDVPAWLAFIFAIALLDFVVYLQHVMFHAIPTLWRLHMVHHTDLDLDVTSGNRFHPVEILISIGIKLAAILVIGPSPVAVIVFEVILNGMAQFNHSNVNMPLHIDRVLRRVVVTPDMHRVHHSVDYAEANSNFGFNLSWWDRLFGTYRAAPKAGHEDMTIGVTQYRDPSLLTLDKLLLLPLRGKFGNYAINARKSNQTNEQP